MKQWINVLRFEYLTFVKSKFFIIVTAVMVLAGLILPSIPSIGGLVGGGLVSVKTGASMGITDTTGLFSSEDYAHFLNGYTIQSFHSIGEMQNAIRGGDIEFGAELAAGYSYIFYCKGMQVAYYEVLNHLNAMLQTKYRLAVFNEAGLNPSETEAILDFHPSSEIETVTVGDSASAKNYQENVVYAYAMLFILYFGLLMFGQYILTSVIREKTTKTMELLITSCKASHLIHGKVFGVGLANLTQLTCLGIASVGSMLFNAWMNAGAEDVFVVAVKPDIIACMFIYFLLGFFAYGYVYASLASTVSRMEDANSAAGLPMMLIIAGFLSSMMGLMNPSAPWVAVLSYVPFISPMVMFMRFALGAASVWEAIVGGVLQLLTILGMGFIGSRIYRMGTLMYGKKLSLKDLAAAIKV
jgi:ABC-2 type transport system permease protein